MTKDRSSVARRRWGACPTPCRPRTTNEARRLLTVVGDAGVGKSRLIREFAADASDRARVVRGRCLPYGDGITFWPLAEIVRDAADIEDDDTQDAALGRSEPSPGRHWMTTSGGRSPTGWGPRWASPIQFPVADCSGARASCSRSLARDRPLVMIVDDIHSAAPTFLDLLDHLLDAHRRRAASCSCARLATSSSIAIPSGPRRRRIG